MVQDESNAIVGLGSDPTEGGTSAQRRGESAPGRRRAWWSAVLTVVVCGAVVGGAPLLLGPPDGDDAYYHAMRAQQQARCWLGGVLLPRWYPDLNGGLGGPEPRAYPLVPLVAHGALALVADDAVGATSAASVLIPLLAGLAMLWTARRRGWAPGLAALAACAWGASPYLVIAVHDRAALAEGWGLALLPLVLDALLPPRPRAAPEVLRAAALFALLLATQLPLALMAVLIVAPWHLAARHAGRPLRALEAGVVGLGLAAISWLPNVAALWRLQGERLTGGSYSWRGNLLPGGLPGDPRLAGHLTLVLAAVVMASLVVVLAGRGEARAHAGAALAAAFLVTPLAYPLYGALPGLDFLQFPWRWLGPATCLLVMGAPRVSSRRLSTLTLAVLLLPLLTFPGLRWRLAPGPALRPSETFTDSARAAQRYGVPPILPSLPAYLPRGAELGKALAAAPASRRHLPAPRCDGPSTWRWELTGEGVAVRLPLLAGPGWSTSLDGRAVPWRAVDSLVTVVVPAGQHCLQAAQAWLAEDVAGAVITSLSVLGLALLGWRFRRRRVPAAH
jgi:hypothetical protein